MLSVKVQMEDDDRDGVIVTPSGRGNTVLEGGFDRQLRRYVLGAELTKPPMRDRDGDADQAGANGQVSLSDATLTFSKRRRRSRPRTGTRRRR